MSRMSKFEQYLEFIHILLIFIFIIVLPPIWIPCYLYRQIVILIAKLFPKHFGKIFSFSDAFLDEDFTSWDSYPQSVIVTTMNVEGNLSLSYLRSHFEKKVLQAELRQVLRYPELQQYPVSFLGHRFWKWDPNFNIENHIKQDPASVFPSSDNYNLGLIHQELLNRPFKPETSPWELLLIQNERGDESLLALRQHHTLGDAKSILKLLVECLGEKPLKTAKPAQIQLTFWEQSSSFLFLPLNYILYLLQSAVYAANIHFHPWKTSHFKNSEGYVVGLSQPLSLELMKEVSKRNGVTTSSLLLSMITRAIQKCFDGQDATKKELGIGYIFPKPEHPPTFTNHAYVGMIHLPFLEKDPKLNLQKCQERFMQLKKSELFKCTDFPALLLGTLPGPLRRIVARNFFGASGITNIAGDEEGFSLGNGVTCSDMCMSVGTLPGGGGLIFCAFSYKQGIRVAVVASKCIINEVEANELAQQVGGELQLLENL